MECYNEWKYNNHNTTFNSLFNIPQINTKRFWIEGTKVKLKGRVQVEQY